MRVVTNSPEATVTLQNILFLKDRHLKCVRWEIYRSGFIDLH